MHPLTLIPPQTFFGCNDSLETPLVLYMPNAPWSAYTNYSFGTPEFTNNQLDLVFENALNIATYGNGKLSNSSSHSHHSSNSSSSPSHHSSNSTSSHHHGGTARLHGNNVTYPVPPSAGDAPTKRSTTTSNTPAFPACLACGMIYKSLLRTGQAVPAACASCFQAHCYSGAVDNSPSHPSYEPSLILQPGLNYAKWNRTVWK